MTEQNPPSGDLVAQIRELLGARKGEATWSLAVPDIEDLLRATRERLLEFSRTLGVTGLSDLTKEAIAKRLQGALRAIIRATPEPAAKSETADAPHKFDLGLPAEREPGPETIPWGYSEDRVTAMVIDPERLFVYWEVTDGAIEHARAQLGAGGRDAWMNLRLYDVTGRLFDGTNAHSYFDHRIERSDRQWFFYIAKPSSTAVVEIGMKSFEGYFVRIARSGRADFPRREPVPPGPVEWLTVRTATGGVGWPEPGAPSSSGGGGGMPPAQEPPAGIAAAREGAPPAAVSIEHVEHGGARVFEGHWDWREIARREWHEMAHTEWHEGGRVLEWVGPVIQTSWEAGPFATQVESPRYVEERHEGHPTAYTSNGRLHVVYGPWQVVIRGLGARAERRVLGVWEIQRSWVASGGAETHLVPADMRPVGGSEARLGGASERRWLAASELRLGGASELARVGASELRYRGASETVFAGASERRMRGASERLVRGASELRYAGASERRLGGASERVGAGASEHRFPGASERQREGR